MVSGCMLLVKCTSAATYSMNTLHALPHAGEHLPRKYMYMYDDVNADLQRHRKRRPAMISQHFAQRIITATHVQEYYSFARHAPRFRT